MNVNNMLNSTIYPVMDRSNNSINQDTKSSDQSKISEITILPQKQKQNQLDNLHLNKIESKLEIKIYHESFVSNDIATDSIMKTIINIKK